jgi:hypothetical protein
MKTSLSALTLVAAAGVAFAGPSNVFDEAVLGDFSDDRFAPTFLDFGFGSNTVISSASLSNDPDFGDRDYFTFTLNAGESVSSINLLSATNPNGGFDSVAFVGLAFDSIFDFDPNINSGPGLVGFALTAPDLVGTDLLGALSGGLDTLGPGDYSIWFQQTGDDLTQVELEFIVVPAPTTAALLGLGGRFATHRRR